MSSNENLETMLSKAFETFELCAASGVHAIEYVEKQFEGDGMSDDEWAAI